MSESETKSDTKRYFPETVKAAGAAPKKRGRKPKVRHDIAEDVPIDGDYRPLDLENEDKAFEYVWMTDKDRGAVGRTRGFVAEKWGPGCCRPRLYFGDESIGSDIRQNELTLMKILRDKREKQRSIETARHRQLARDVLKLEAYQHGRTTARVTSAKHFEQEITS